MDRFSTAASREFKTVLLRALSSSRDDVAIDFLLALIRKGSPAECNAAIEALSLHKDSEDIQTRIKAAKT
jgi:hypothetical protein